MFSFQTIQVFMFLIPGLLASIVMRSMIVRKDKNQLGELIEALIYSLIIYTIYFAFTGDGTIPLRIDPSSLQITYNWESLILLFIISLIFSTILGALTFYDIILRIARRLKLTKKTSRASVWHDVFTEYCCQIIINFKDSRRIMGYPRYYSDDPENKYIFLQQPAWVVQNEKTGLVETIDLDEEGILITPEQGIESIEFLKSSKRPGAFRRLAMAFRAKISKQSISSVAAKE